MVKQKEQIFVKQKNKNGEAEGEGIGEAKEAGVGEAKGLELVNQEKELVKQEQQRFGEA
jgi:hypothetical protein